jgi:O-antigen ligase/tetratricopeptide (TPR) repeat protein
MSVPAAASVAPAARAGQQSWLEIWTRWSLPLLCLLLILAFWPALNDQFELPKAVILHLGAGLALLALARIGGLERGLLRRPALLAAAAFGLSALLSTLAAYEPRTSLFGQYAHLQGLLTLGAEVGLLVTAACLVRSEQRLADVLSAVALGVAIASVYTVGQYFGLDPAGMAPQVEDGRRTYSTIGHPNTVGELLALTLPLTGWLALRARGLTRDLCLWTLGGQVVALALTGARSAWGIAALEVVALVGIVAIRRIGLGRLLWRPLAVALPMLAITATGLVLLAPSSAARVDAAVSQAIDRGSPLQTRQLLWQSAIALGVERPALGWGPDAFALAYPRHRSVALDAAYGNVGQDDAVHNLYLGAIVDGGLLGVAALVIWQMFSLSLLLRPALTGVADGELRPATGAALGLTFAAYFGLYVLGEHRLAVDWAPWLVSGAALGLTRRPGRLLRLPNAARWLAGGLGLLLLLEGGSLLAADLAQGVALRRAFRESFRSAVEMQEVAVTLRPFEPQYWERLAGWRLDQYFDTRNSAALDRALAAARKAVTLERSLDASSVALLARITQEWEQRAGTPTDAPVLLTRQAVALDPSNPLLHAAAAEVALRAGQPEAARADLARAEAASRSPDAFARVAALHAMLGEQVAAREALRRAAGQEWRAPLQRERYAAWGDAALATGAFDQALLAFDVALQSAPDDLSLQTRRAEALAGMNRTQEALAQARQVLDRQPGNRRAAALVERLGGTGR